MNHGWSIGIGMENTLLFDSNVSGVYKRLAIKENINKKEKEKGILLLTLNCIPGSPAQYIHTSYRS